jgi:hypothetical protein
MRVAIAILRTMPLLITAYSGFVSVAIRLQGRFMD